MKKIILLSLLFLSFSSLGEVRVKIERNGTITNQAEFETKEKADKWLDQEISNGSFGKPAHTICNKIDPRNLQETDCRGIPSEFTVLPYEDMTSEVQEREARKLAKIDRKKKLKEIDWSKITTVAHVKDIVKNILAEIEE